MSQPSNATPPPINPYDDQAHRGMSSGGKVLVTLGIGCGLLLLLCCGGIGLGGFAVVKIAQNSAVEDPKRIDDITDEIVSMQIPETLEPVVGLNVNLPVIGPVMKGSVYGDKAKQSNLILGQFNQQFVDQHSLETQLRSATSEKHEDIDIEETEPFDSKIHNEPAHFEISRGKGHDSKEEYWEVVGEFRGSEGPAMLIFKGRAGEFTKDQVLEMLNSMK
jgi:hypothetical protein